MIDLAGPSAASLRREVRGWCALCRSRCGSISVVEGGRLIEVRPDPDHPTGGALCPKGRAGPEIVHSSRRILKPLRRTRPKTDADPGWREISWDEALDEVASRLDAARREIGPEAVAFAVTTPSGTPMSDSIDWVERFVRLFGSPNSVYGVEVCNWHKDHAHAFTFGCGIPVAQYRDADLIMLWGHNPSTVWLAQADAIAAGRRRGAKMLVIDPRRSAHAAEADLWLQVRPGTDAALALGLARLLIETGRYDQSFVRAWSNGPLLVRDDDGEYLRAGNLRDWDHAPAEAFVARDPATDGPTPLDTRFSPEGATGLALQEGPFVVETRDGPVPCRTAFARYVEACRPYDPDRVERITGIPPSALRRAADLLAEAGHGIAYHSWTGVGQHRNATQTERAIATLYGLTGAFDTRRGNLRMAKLPVNPLTSFGQLPAGQRDKALGRDRLPLGPPALGWIIGSDLYGAVLEEKPYPVRALVAFGSNLLLAQPDTRRAREALERLPFHVHCDLFHTPTSAFADIVLPVSTPWEREALKIGFEITQEAEEVVALRPAAIPPVGEGRSDAEIVIGLADRLGMRDEFFGGSLEAGWNHVLAPLGLSVEALRESGGRARRTLTRQERTYASPVGPEAGDGSVPVRGFDTESRRVELYSPLLARHGYSPVPVHVEQPTRPGETRLPLILLSSKLGHFCHSQHRAIGSLRRRSPDPTVELHPDLAQSRGIVAGDWVRIVTAIGEARFRARLDPSLKPDVVAAQNGWWQACVDLGLPGYDPLGPEGSNFNAVIGGRPDERDPISGAPAMRSFPCDIARLEGARSWTGFRPLRVAAVHPEAEGVVSLLLEAEDGELMPAPRPGQHLPLRVERRGPRTGPPLIRSYSVSDAPDGQVTSSYRITVKQIEADELGGVSAGQASTELTRHVRAGDRVEAQVPSGKFALPLEADFPIVLMAAGIGITPFQAWLEALSRRPRRPEILLLYGNRNGRQHVFKHRLAELARTMPELTVATAYSRPDASDREGVDFDRLGRISADLVPQHLIDKRARAYLCGPNAMLSELSAALAGRGMFPFEIFRETFGAAEMPAPQRPDAAFRVRFARSGRETIWTPASGTLLELADRLGLDLPAGCRVGQCESCVVPLVSGQVTLLSDAEVDGTSCLTCRSLPASDLVLDA